MNKKIWGLLLASIFVLSQVMYVSAAPSAEVPSGGSYGDDFTDVIEDHTALKIIDYVNNTDASNAECIRAINEFSNIRLEGGVLLTDFYKLENIRNTSNSMYEFDVYVPNLPNNVKLQDIRGLVYYADKTPNTNVSSNKRFGFGNLFLVAHAMEYEDNWEMITPIVSVNKTVTFRTTYKPSAIAIYLPPTSTTTSPVTGAVLGCGIVMSLAAASFAISAITYRKSKED